MSRKKGFTLIEMVLVIVVFSILIAVVFTTYNRMIQLKINVEARQTLIDRSYYMMEKLHVMMADYTIDYEEYFNRKIVGCDEAGVRGTGGSNGYCDRFTYYGNGNGFCDPFLDTSPSSLDEGCLLAGREYNKLIYPSSTVVSLSSSQESYLAVAPSSFNMQNTPRLYGSYAAMFMDVRGDVDTVDGQIGDEDDVDMGRGPVAIPGEVGELYLISYDGSERLYLRRARVGSGDRNDDGHISPTEQLYSLQQLQLEGADAGYNHEFGVGPNYEGLYDGKIDTWFCNASLQYHCAYTPRVFSNTNLDDGSMAKLYQDADYAMPIDEYDGRVDIFGSDVTVTDRGLRISPDTDPELAWAEDDKQISPSVTVSMTTQLYAENRIHKLGDTPVESFKLPLQTTFAMKQFYR